MQKEQRFSHPFSPFIDKSSTTLILGSFPSLKSFEENFYYAHPQNQFWRLLAAVYNEATPQTIEEKKRLLQKHNIALWDMVGSCERENSLDSNLKNIEPNDIEALLREYPNIQRVCFTSKSAQRLYEKHFGHLQLGICYLASPSPAYAVLRFEQKLQQWKKALK